MHKIFRGTICLAGMRIVSHVYVKSGLYFLVFSTNWPVNLNLE